MPNYAIGDIQGCFDSLKDLLKKFNFDESKDTLWLTGDLVNRGPKSLETLRFIKNLKGNHRIVLGNHDLHLLSVASNAHPGFKEDTFQDILKAPDRDELIAWLSNQPLIQHDKNLGFTMIHASLAPDWDLDIALQLSKEIEDVIQSDNAFLFFEKMYGDTPIKWTDELTGFNRLRCITNYFTRGRAVTFDGSLSLKYAGKKNDIPDNLTPWFKLPNRKNADLKIIFGHWAALGGVTDTPNTYALDTGCVWGYKLTAMRLEDEVRFSVDSVK